MRATFNPNSAPRTARAFSLDARREPGTLSTLRAQLVSLSERVAHVQQCLQEEALTAGDIAVVGTGALPQSSGQDGAVPAVGPSSPPAGCTYQNISTQWYDELQWQQQHRAARRRDKRGLIGYFHRAQDHQIRQAPAEGVGYFSLSLTD